MPFKVDEKLKNKLKKCKNISLMGLQLDFLLSLIGCLQNLKESKQYGHNCLFQNIKGQILNSKVKRMLLVVLRDLCDIYLTPCLLLLNLRFLIHLL